MDCKMNCLLCFLVTCAMGSVLTTNPKAVPTKIKLIKDINKFVRAHPDVTLTKLDTPRTGRDIHTKHYAMGQRVTGDRLVYTEESSDSWESSKSVQAIVIYPTNGEYGAVISYVSVFVNQTSIIGDDFVFFGGIDLSPKSHSPSK
ncbi:uncharacterized protein LOC129807819 [Phlebotomus papatasi]|uniref:uncharacterized protein LOC129807819 n=1 Tax=Phlebotomus papatasi TaxID=29031 RepID=UPI0024843731|nr:uncharacterized protein LOC129807819 [Phlebotomus papatasi]